MKTSALSPQARKVEALFEQPTSNPLQSFLQDEAARSTESQGWGQSSYDLFLIRRNTQAGDEVLGPKPLHTGNYPEEILYGAGGSHIPRFRAFIKALAEKAETLAALDSNGVEYGHRTALFWADLGRAKDFLNVSPAISEIAAELRTARFQMLGRDTPVNVIATMAKALHQVADAKRVDEAVIDRFVETLEEGGFDSFAQDALRETDA